MSVLQIRKYVKDFRNNSIDFELLGPDQGYILDYKSDNPNPSFPAYLKTASSMSIAGAHEA